MQKKKEAKKNTERYVVIGCGSWCLWYGKVRETDAAILKTKSAKVYDCRHVRYWYGGTGGITSLAAWGPCGTRAKESRIGAPCPSSLVTDVKAVHEYTSEAIAAFAAIEAVRT